MKKIELTENDVDAKSLQKIYIEKIICEFNVDCFDLDELKKVIGNVEKICSEKDYVNVECHLRNVYGDHELVVEGYRLETDQELRQRIQDQIKVCEERITHNSNLIDINTKELMRLRSRQQELNKQ